jgi:hypothetical protein
MKLHHSAMASGCEKHLLRAQKFSINTRQSIRNSPMDSQTLYLSRALSFTVSEFAIQKIRRSIDSYLCDLTPFTFEKLYLSV